uniref:carnitine O-palmitoyltransferase n=1 Tax=Panagrellus redivivus TaxID=6233 RepID=A0A7E4VSQ6_PANRE
MAEAHSISALSLSLTHDGISVSYDQELLRDIWHAFSRGYKRRIAHFKNDFTAGIFPANLQSLLFVNIVSIIMAFLNLDNTLGIAAFFRNYVFYYFFGVGLTSKYLGVIVAGVLLWLLLIQILRLSLKTLLTYKGWMYESAHQKNVSLATKVWFAILHFISKCGPILHSYQGALPHLPLPSLDDTLKRHLESMKPITSEAEYNELVELTEKFRKGLGRRLQRYLVIKSWLSVNYVTDWWEEFVYLRQRSPIMINSNYYGFDTLNLHPTKNQAARAANVTWAACCFRRLIERQEVSPFSIAPKTKVPFCNLQYTRMFNSCRVPGEETDSFRHWDDIKHVAVYCRGCWFKVLIHNGKRLLEPAELQAAYEQILNGDLTPAPGEEQLAIFTAGERTHWAVARRKYFSNGVNKSSLHVIERAAFVVILDDEEQHFDVQDSSKLDHFAESLLHGKGNDRWFDKSINFIITKNGRVGVNAEHSWADAAVTAHAVEYVLLNDLIRQGYDAEGNTIGTKETVLAPERLKWNLDSEVQEQMAVSRKVAQALIDDVEMALLVWTEFGKGFIKKLRISPDAFLQACLQLTYFRNQNKFSLTYEASMTRLFREGRTETVRSCSDKSCDFVRAMLDPNSNREERLKLLRISAEKHQSLYRDAMTGRGVDRHLFALYVVQRYLEEESPFFNKIFPPTYLLSTSQTPLNQCEEDAKDLSSTQRNTLVSAGGGFGPVADRGYGVSYIVAGEDTISFHISSKKSADNTSSAKFRQDLIQSLRDMRELFAQPEAAPAKETKKVA